MSCKKYYHIIALCALALASSIIAFAQSERPLTWQEDLNYLAKASALPPAVVRATLSDIRAEVENWLKLHPDSKIKLPSERAETSGDQARDQIKLLQQTVASILKEDPNRPFHLGTAQVNVTARTSELSPVADSIDQSEMAKRNSVNVAMAMEDLPGVSIEHNYGGRNQDEVWVHGFNYRQVPLYLDGIPMNVPYDGTMDFKRIQTSDVAEVQIAKGFSSPLLGPNAAGGAINVVTKEPQQKIEGDALIGGMSADGLQSSLRLGGRRPHFFVQGAMDWLQSNYVPLSGNFVTTNYQTNDQLNHSYAQDAKYSGRVGWTPRRQDEYVFSYINQKANEGIPTVTGNDPLPGTTCYGITSATDSSCLSKGTPYRAWGFWDKTSYYFHSDTGLGQSSSLKTRIFYDQYPNLMYFYNMPTGAYAAYAANPYVPANFSTGNELYRDHSDGISTEFNTRVLPRNSISGSFLFKDDTHKEVPQLPYGTTGSKNTSNVTAVTASTPDLADRQQTVSIGVQDVVTFTPHLLATVGFSADHLDGLRAVTSNTPNNGAFLAPACPGNTNPADFSACTPHVWGYNPQASASYSFHDSGKLFVAFAQKTRFPLMKDMYSYGVGTGLPNPLLKPERSENWVFGYSRAFAAKTVAQLDFFRSDLHNAIESLTIPDPGLAAGATASCPNSTTATCSVGENSSTEIHEGMEFTVRTTPLPRLTFDGNYTYLDKRIGAFNGMVASLAPCGGGFLANTNGTLTTAANDTCFSATDVPKHKAVVSGTLRLPRDSALTTSVRYESGTKESDNFTCSASNSLCGTTNKNVYYAIMPMSNFATVNMGGNVQLYKGASMQAGVRNLFDRNYFYVIGIPEEGRNWYVNMRYRFGAE